MHLLADGVVVRILHPLGEVASGSKSADNLAVDSEMRRRQFFTRFWVNDYGLHILLIALLVMMFVAPALVAARLLPPSAVHVFFVLTVVSGVMTVARRGHLPVITLLFAVLTVTVRFVEVSTGHTTLTMLDAVLSGAMIAVFVALILAQVFRAGPVTVHRIEGAVAAYLLLGLLWGCAFRVVWLAVPGAFATAAGALPDDPMLLYYFSFVTLTTTGYGDILPVAPAARGLATMEALIGQLYPAILIARLVSLQIYASNSEPPGNDA